ncbi:MAG: aminotransferase class I/II-fold pyridoxal phosphate-dependent enzyme, partial [Verrucomicrobia bacterium]|nr:aminotransferase class I/II-fold pyridoxal phosphate-dependent enzyme [Verrucomicrobiota bacterium]
ACEGLIETIARARGVAPGNILPGAGSSDLIFRALRHWLTPESLERFAARSENTLVCKSMSKVYALSGARVAYLCAGPHQLETLRAITPPWVVSLPAQVAAVRASEDPDYYATRYQETHALQESLARELRSLDWEVRPGVANFLLCHLPEKSLDAEALIERCREQGLFLRNAGLMGMGPDSVRVAVKDAETNRRMVNILQEVTGKHSGQGRPTTI